METLLHKCGDITTLMHAEGREYLIYCVFCGSVFSALDNFTKHVETYHLIGCNNMESLENYMFEETHRSEVQAENSNTALSTGNNMDSIKYNTFEEEGISILFNTDDMKEAELAITGESESYMEYYEDEEFHTEDAEPVNAFEETDADWSDVDKDTLSDPLKLFDKETILTIFSKFENYSILWDREDPTCKNLNLRTIAYKSLASDVGKVNKWKSVRELVKKFSCRLRHELQKKKEFMLYDVNYTARWIEDIDSFLKLKKKKKKDVLPPSILTGSQRDILITLYKTLTCLWNETDKDYRLPNKRQEAMIELQRSLQKSGILLTQSELAQEIALMRTICWNEKKRKLNCEDMKTQYVTEYSNYKQIKFLEVDVGPFRCEQCKEILHGLNKFKMHKSIHDGIKPFTCPLCSNSFTTIHSLNTHISRHTGDYKYTCKYCNKGFHALSEVSVHERIHTGERPYFCDQCGKTFRVWVYYDAHMRRHQNRPNYECRVCSKTFFGAYQLKEHMSIHKNERDQICNVCGKGFKMAKYLRQHMQIHSNKKYICKICNKAFSQYPGLSGHMKSHGTTLIGSNKKINKFATNISDNCKSIPT